MKHAFFSLVVLGSIGCAAGAGTGPNSPTKKLSPPNPFPSRASLETIASAPPKPMKKLEVVAAQEWSVDPRDQASVVEPKLASIAGAKAAVAITPEMRCVARELARFQLQHKSMPDERLNRFIVAACGATTSVSAQWLTFEVPEKVTDEKLLPELAGKLTPKEEKSAIGGAWLARKNNRAIVMVVRPTKPDADASISPVDANGRFTIKGEIHVSGDAATALVNQTDHSVAVCDADASVSLPKFGFVCSMAADDKSAWTEIALKQPGLVLTRVVFSGIVRRDPSAPLVFKATTRAPTPVTSPKEVRDAVLAGVNEARANAGIAPLALAPKETAVSERLAAHFLSSETTGDHEVSDKVALGLLAGWDVEGGIIRSGGFYAGFSPGSDDANRFVEHALESPVGRHALLDPHARQIAIGAAPPGEFGGVGAVVTTYSFFEGNDPAAEAKKVLAHLATLRAQQGLAAPSPIAGLEGLASQARLVGGGRAEPMAALDQALNLEVARYRHALRGWVVATNDLDHMPLPPELVVPANVAVGIEVAHWKPEGAAWGSYVVFLVAPGDATPAPGTVAMR